MREFLCATVSATENAAGMPSAGATGGGMDFTAVFLIISLLVAIAIPVGGILFGKIKYKGSFKMTLWGILGHVGFYMFLSSIMSTIFLQGYLDQESTYVEATVYILIQVICMELGRFLLLFLTRKKRNSWGDGLMFATGYCIMDTIIICLFFVVPYLIIVLSSDGGQIDGMWRELRVFVKDSNLVEGEEWRFIVKALTSMVFCALQISSTMLMHIAIQKKEKWMVALPILVDVAIMIPNRMHSYDAWYWGNNFVILPYLTIMAAICCLVTYLMWKNRYNVKDAELDLSYLDKMKEIADEK